MCDNATPTAAITASGETFHLGSLISNDNGAQNGIKARLRKARGAIVRFHSIWKSNQCSLKPTSDGITAM